MYTYEFINYPLSSIILHVNLMFNLVMNLWWVPFHDLVCVPDYSLLCVKDKVHKLTFVTLFRLCWNIYTSQRLAHLILIWSMFTCKVFRNIFLHFSAKLHFPTPYKYFFSCAFKVTFL